MQPYRYIRSVMDGPLRHAANDVELVSLVGRWGGGIDSALSSGKSPNVGGVSSDNGGKFKHAHVKSGDRKVEILNRLGRYVAVGGGNADIAQFSR